MEFMAPLEHRSMFRDQGIGALLPLKVRAFFDPDIGPFGGSPEGSEGRHIGIEPQAIVAPMPGCDHPSIEIQDSLKLGAVECRNRTPVPRMRKRRDDAQALFTLGWG